MPGGSAEQLLDALTFRRADGREVSLEEFPLAQALSTGETVRAEEIVIEVPGGGSVTTLVNATPIRSEEGEVVSVVVTLQDMTPLEELERLRAEFLGMVSHELRTPLTSIKGSAATLTETASDLDPAEMLQFFRIIGEQADYMRDLIGDLLDVARIETGEMSVAPAPSEVATLVDEARSRFQSGGGRSNLRIDLSPELPLVMADGRRIIQVLNNLLTNAAPVLPRGVRHRGVRRAGGLPRGCHRHGRGPGDRRRAAAAPVPEVLPHRRRGPETGHRGVGAGPRHLQGDSGGPTGAGYGPRATGLAWGRGSPSRFQWPGMPQPAFPGSPPAGSGRSGSGSASSWWTTTRRRSGTSGDALARAGYAPIVTGDPQEALSQVEANDPHLVLLDLMLPGTDGIELMGNILDMADVPVIFLSAYGQEETIARAFENGADDYVVKPFSPTELVARIKAALRKREAPEWAEPSEPYVFGDLTIDYAQRRVTLAGRPVQLTAIEYGLLFELSANAGRVMTYDRLLRRVWGLRRSGDSRRVRTAAKQLRRKLGDDANNPTYILNEPRVGYRMEKGETQELEKASQS